MCIQLYPFLYFFVDSIRTRSSEEGSDSGVGTPRGHASMFNGSGGGSGCDDSPVSPPGMEQVTLDNLDSTRPRPLSEMMNMVEMEHLLNGYLKRSIF